MSKTSPASSILTKVARIVLGPLGMRQKRRSRLWIDDHGWWLGLVEFQPGWGQGSYLNVAPMWLWSRTDHFSFDAGDIRVHGHVEFRDETQFSAAAEQLAALAKTHVLALRSRFANLEAVAAHTGTTPLEHGGWPEYHAGVAAALTGAVARARAAFAIIRDANHTPDAEHWQSLRRLAAELHDRCSDACAFREWTSGVIAETRRSLRLDPLDGPAFR